MKNVVGLFDNMQDAEAVVRDLRDAGVGDADISFAGRNQDTAASDTGDYVAEGHSEAAEGAGFGATGGTVVGGLTGLLVGLGALAIPGVGPVIAAGTLATALGSAALGAGIGAATGGLLGALVGAGIPEEDANLYSEGIRRGGALVMAQVDDSMVDTALDIMERHNVVDIDERGGEYRQSGWSRFDANEPYTTSAARAGAAVADAGAAGTNFDRPDTDATISTTDTTYANAGDADQAPDESDYARSSKIGTAGGGVAGAATGAALGSAGGPIGTVVGGVAGAVVGAGVGAAGDAAGVETTDDSGRAADYDRRDMSSESYGSTTDTAYRGGANDTYATRDLSDPSYSTSGAGFGTTGTGYGATGTGATRRSRTYDAVDTSYGGSDVRGRSVGEGPVENTASRIENATERGLNTDLDRDGDVGRRDARDNY